MNKLSIICLFSAFPFTIANANNKPNVILIVLDDLGYSDVGFTGCKDILTPHIDKIAQRGVFCRNAYVSAPYSGPSRCGIMTGRYQQRFGGECNIGAYQESVENDYGVPNNERMIPEMLKQQGYQTAVIGKWHLGDSKSKKPLARGADYYYGFSGGAYNYWGAPGSGEYGFIEENERVVPSSETSYLTDDFTDKTLDFIDTTNQASPFFIYLSYNAPHEPLQAPQKYLDRTKHIFNPWRSVYAAMILAVDDGIGRILQKLEDKGIEDDTMIIFLSDNGGTASANNYPLRAYKGNMFEGGVRVPFVISWGDRLPKNTTYDGVVSSLDLFPTIAHAAGVDEPEKKYKLDGINLMSQIVSKKNGVIPERTLFWRTGNGFEYAVRQGDYKIVYCYNSTSISLFKLSQDPLEMNDISAANGDIVNKLQTEYVRWSAKMTDPLWSDPHIENQKKDMEKWIEVRKRALRQK